MSASASALCPPSRKRRFVPPLPCPSAGSPQQNTPKPAAERSLPRAVAAVSGQMVWELLGEEADAPGLIAALKLESATVRTPGKDRPFAMAIGAEAPIYLGLALD